MKGTKRFFGPVKCKLKRCSDNVFGSDPNFCKAVVVPKSCRIKCFIIIQVKVWG